MRADLEIVKVKGSCNWAVRVVIDNLFLHPRYRGFYYKKDAVRDMGDWQASDVDERNYNHNFHTAKELHIEEIK